VVVVLCLASIAESRAALRGLQSSTVGRTCYNENQCGYGERCNFNLRRCEYSYEQTNILGLGGNLLTAVTQYIASDSNHGDGQLNGCSDFMSNLFDTGRGQNQYVNCPQTAPQLSMRQHLISSLTGPPRNNNQVNNNNPYRGGTPSRPSNVYNYIGDNQPTYQHPVYPGPGGGGGNNPLPYPACLSSCAGVNDVKSATAIRLFACALKSGNLGTCASGCERKVIDLMYAKATSCPSNLSALVLGNRDVGGPPVGVRAGRSQQYQSQDSRGQQIQQSTLNTVLSTAPKPQTQTGAHKFGPGQPTTTSTSTSTKAAEAWPTAWTNALMSGAKSSITGSSVAVASGSASGARSPWGASSSSTSSSSRGNGIGGLCANGCTAISNNIADAFCQLDCDVMVASVPSSCACN